MKKTRFVGCILILVLLVNFGKMEAARGAIAASALLAGNVYYVDGNNPAASDLNAGTIDSPWKTIHKANQALQPGDTVYIRAGTYYVGDELGYPTASTETQGINPKNSGTAGHPITYSNYNDENVTLVGTSGHSFAMNLSSDASPRSYIIVRGIHCYNFNKFLWILRGTHIEVAYSTFDHSYYQDTRAEWRGSTMYRNSQYNHIHHCTFSSYANLYGQSDNGVVFELGNENVSDDFTAYNLIEDNLFYHGGHHVLGISGSYNVIRNNYIHNENWWADDDGIKWGNRILFFAGPDGSNQRNLVEGNHIAFGGETSEPDQVGGSGGTLATSYNIIRRNLYYKTLLYAIYIGTYPGMVSSYNHIYHNVFYQNGYSISTKPNMSQEYTHAIYFGVGSGAGDYSRIHDNSIKNNIFYKNKNNGGTYCGADSIVRSSCSQNNTPPLAQQTIANNLDGGLDPLFVYDESPLDPFGSQPDFHLRPGSPAIDTGISLTTITSSSGSGTSFQVADAGYFMDGWGIEGVQGDEIQLSRSTQRAFIIDIDYETNTITVDRELTWTADQGVSLAYEGTAPDIGAYEFDTGELSPTFVDVPFDHWAHDYIEALYQGGYISGCSTSPLMYCPERIMNRAESAVFIVRGVHGAEFMPPDPTEKIFEDIPLTEWYAKWATQLWNNGYTAGCGTDPLIYCPLQEHTIAEGSVFYLRMLHGAEYKPSPPTGIFADVPLDAWYARWVEEAYQAGILIPCQTEPELNACPLEGLDRAMGAYMMVQAKGLQIP
jgi:hypothetical protein